MSYQQGEQNEWEIGNGKGAEYKIPQHSLYTVISMLYLITFTILIGQVSIFSGL